MRDITLSPFRIGRFIGAVITFIIVAFVIFLIVKITKKWGIEWRKVDLSSGS